MMGVREMGATPCPRAPTPMTHLQLIGIIISARPCAARGGASERRHHFLLELVGGHHRFKEGADVGCDDLLAVG